jgi:hypothetical protein
MRREQEGMSKPDQFCLPSAQASLLHCVKRAPQLLIADLQGRPRWQLHAVECG